jgi:cell division protein FtsB
MNESSRSKRVNNVLSLQVARERSNQRLLERLEAENAQLRDCVVELMLEIQALHDGAK